MIVALAALAAKKPVLAGPSDTISCGIGSIVSDGHRRDAMEGGVWDGNELRRLQDDPTKLDRLICDQKFPEGAAQRKAALDPKMTERGDRSLSLDAPPSWSSDKRRGPREGEATLDIFTALVVPRPLGRRAP